MDWTPIWIQRRDQEAQRRAQEQQQVQEARRRAQEQQQVQEARRRAQEEAQAQEARRRAQEQQAQQQQATQEAQRRAQDQQALQQQLLRRQSQQQRPKYTASPVELETAHLAVARAEGIYRRLAADGNSTQEDRDYAYYQWKRALQDEADLKAGYPGFEHLDLDIEGARVSLALAKQEYRKVLADGQATQLDRETALNLVHRWEESLNSLLSRK